MQGKFFGIGVGPGDPELLTVKAINILKNIDAVIAPKTEKKSDSLALSIAKILKLSIKLFQWCATLRSRKLFLKKISKKF